MGDKLGVSYQKLKKLQLETHVSRKTIVKRYKNSSKSAKRKNRRKRSKKTYLNKLRKERVTKRTQELCDEIQEFNVIDMDTTTLDSQLSGLPQEITEWQKKDQIAYWKSRAISLELENKMLRQHLRNAYVQQIEYSEKSKGWQSISNPSNNRNEDVPTTSTSTSKTSCDEPKLQKTEKKVLPKEPNGKNRLEEMRKIYGNEAQKLMGMETANQLNYERLVDDGSIGYWPNIPLNL